MEINGFDKAHDDVREAIERLKSRSYELGSPMGDNQRADLALIERHIEELTEERDKYQAGSSWAHGEILSIERALDRERAAHSALIAEHVDVVREWKRTMKTLAAERAAHEQVVRAYQKAHTQERVAWETERAAHEETKHKLAIADECLTAVFMSGYEKGKDAACEEIKRNMATVAAKNGKPGILRMRMIEMTPEVRALCDELAQVKGERAQLAEELLVLHNNGVIYMPTRLSELEVWAKGEE